MTRCGKSIASAYSLVELMGVLAILAAIAAIILPRVIGSDEQSKIAGCETHKGNIEVQAELWLQNTGSWPAANLSDVGGDLDYFPQGLPICPVDGSSYTIDAATGRVMGHTH